MTPTDQAARLFNDYDKMSVKVNNLNRNEKMKGIVLYNPINDPEKPEISKIVVTPGSRMQT